MLQGKALEIITGLVESGMSLQWMGRAMEMVGNVQEPEGAMYIVHLLGERVLELTGDLENELASILRENPEAIRRMAEDEKKAQ